MISASSQAPLALRSLQNRCLVPGCYSTHLQRWLTYYPSGQVQSPNTPHWDPLTLLFPSHKRLLRNTVVTTSLSLVADCGWGRVAYQPSCFNGEHPEVPGYHTLSELHTDPQVGEYDLGEEDRGASGKQVDHVCLEETRIYPVSQRET